MVFSSVLLVGCTSELYTGLSEKEANAMLALLQRHHIGVDKVSVKGGKVSLRVNNSDQAEAIRILNREGFPREHFDTVPGLFPQDSLIKSPLEEQARFTYAKSQEIAAILAEIDGVLSAKVHLVLPSQEARRGKGGEPEVATASVFIKHSTLLEVSRYTQQIKLLVSKAVSGLSYDNISVVFFPTETSYDSGADSSYADFLFIRVDRQSKVPLMVLLLSLACLAIFLPMGMFVWHRRQRPLPADSGKSGAGEGSG